MNKALIGIDPLFLNDVKILINDISLLVPVKYDQVDVFQYHSRLIKYIQVCGVITAVKKASSVTTFTVDDSTGTIECNIWNDRLSEAIHLGSTVRAIGKISVYKGIIELACHDIFPLKDTNYELLHICQAISTKSEYKKPLILPSEIRSHQDKLIQEIPEKNRDKLELINTSNEILTVNDFKRVLLICMKQLKLDEFTTFQLKNKPELFELATNTYKHLYKYDSALNKKVMAFLTRIIHELAEEGDLEQLDHTMFKLVDDERLMDKLTGIISLSEQREGLSLDRITVELQKMDEFSRVSKRKVTRTLNTLIKASIIYPTQPNHFRAL